MENNIDVLQIKIDKARAALPQKSREAVDFVSWKTSILNFLGKYNPVQLENLETETELLLCGLVSPEEYPHELEARMHISKDEVNSLIQEMDKLVFKKIQKELERKLDNDTKEPYPNKKTTLDPRFEKLPKDIQQSIAESNYQVTLYTIASKYKLTAEQMGILEEITIKVIDGTIHPDKYEEELASKISIKREDIANLVLDINEKIFKVIRGVEKKYWDEEKNKTGDGIPLPPYGKTVINYEPASPNSPRVEASQGGLKITNEEKAEDEVPLPPPNRKSITNEDKKEMEPIVGISDTPQNIIEEKLKGVTVSDRTVSDHSLPKMNDPYREPF